MLRLRIFQYILVSLVTITNIFLRALKTSWQLLPFLSNIILFLLETSFSRIGFSHQIKTQIVYTSKLLVKPELANLDAPPHNKTKKTPTKLTTNGENLHRRSLNRYRRAKERWTGKNKRKTKSDESIRYVVNGWWSELFHLRNSRASVSNTVSVMRH